jgi:hypothetical protein
MTLKTEVLVAQALANKRTLVKSRQCFKHFGLFVVLHFQIMTSFCFVYLLIAALAIFQPFGDRHQMLLVIGLQI